MERLTDEQILKAHDGELCRDCGRFIAQAQLDQDLKDCASCKDAELFAQQVYERLIDKLRAEIAQEIREKVESLQLHCDTCRCTACEELREFWKQYEVQQ